MKMLERAALLFCFLTVSGLSYAQTTSVVDLGTAASFAVLGASTVTNTGPTVLNGNLGLYSGTSITGFQAVDAGPGIVNGTIYYPGHNGAVAQTAQADALAEYNVLAGLAPTDTPGSNELGGVTLLPGVYFLRARLT